MDYRIEVSRDADLVGGLEREAGFLRGDGEVARRMRLEPDGTFVARDAKGAPLGTASCLVHREGALAWIGGMYVVPSARRRGIARVLLSSCLDHASRRGAARVGLDASALGRPLYETVGFRAVGPTTRWRRAHAAPAPEPAPRLSLTPLSTAELRDVAAYDRPRFGANRSPWIAEVLAENPTRAFAAYDRDSGRLVGYSLGQEAFMGPIVADTAAAASRLLRACEAAGTPPLVHVMDAATRCVELLARAGYEPMGETTQTRMVRGGALGGQPDAQWALGAWAVG